MIGLFKVPPQTLEEGGGPQNNNFVVIWEPLVRYNNLRVAAPPQNPCALPPPFPGEKGAPDTVKNIDLDPDILVDDSLIVWSEWRIVGPFLPCLHCLYVYG
jgi:hypothetical protein